MEFRRIYPNTPSKLFFDGGLNSKFQKALIKENESPDCLNVVFEDGAVGTRGGTSKLNTSAIGSFAFDGVYTRVDRTGAETMVAFAGGSAWFLSGTTFSTIPSAQSVFTAGVRVGTCQSENYLFCGNGYVSPYKYNGASWTRHGVPAPTASATATSSASGVLTGDYKYKFTYINSGAVESDVSPVMASTFTAASATIDVVFTTAPASFGVNARRVYRTEAGGTSYKYLTEIANNTATVYVDNNADTSLGAAAPTDQGEPPNYQIAVWHPGVQRMFVNDPSNENYIWYSEALNPYVFKATNWDSFGELSTDIVNGFVPIENGMLVVCRSRSYLWYFPDNTPANWVKILNKTAYGSNSPFALVPYKDGVLVPVTENRQLVGIAHLVGANVAPDATLLTMANFGSDVLSERIEAEIFAIPRNMTSRISAISFKNKIYFGIASGTGITANNRVLLFDYSSGRIKKDPEYSWVPWSGMTPEQFTIYDGKLYYATSSATGFIYEMNTSTYADDASAINSYYFTKEFAGFMNEVEFHKDFRFANILLDLPGDYYMDILTKVDSDKGTGDTTQVDVDPGSTLWGTGVWGSSVWGGGKYQEDLKLDLGTLSGKRIQFKFSNQNKANQRFKVHYMSINYNLKGLR